MAMSGSTDFSVNRDDIIKRALRLLGVTAQGETPTSDQTTEAALALNGLVKALEADGMPLWALKSTTITLTATATYRIGLSQTVNTPKPLKIIQAWIRNTSSNVDIPLRIVTKQEYNSLGNKTSSGTPSQLYYDVQNSYGDINLFPVPDNTVASANQLHIVYQRPFEDFDSSTDAPDFPQEWFDAITYSLATRLAPEYGIDPTMRKMLWQEMTIIKNDALSNGTEEGSLYFQVDRRGY